MQTKFGWLALSVVFLIAAALFIAVFPKDAAIPRLAVATEVLLIGGLVLVTTPYTKSTRDIAGKTADLASLTHDSLVEMREQRYLSVQPWPIPRLVDSNGEFADPVPLWFDNVGSGPAVDLRLFVSDQELARVQEEWQQRTGPSGGRRTGPRWQAMGPADHYAWPAAFENPREGESGVIGIEYRDIYGREFLSGWQYRVAKVDDERLVLVAGEPLLPISR